MGCWKTCGRRTAKETKLQERGPIFAFWSFVVTRYTSMPPYATADSASKPKRRARSSSRARASKGRSTRAAAAKPGRDSAAAAAAATAAAAAGTADAAAAADAWIYKLDVAAFKKDMDSLKSELTKDQGPADVEQYVYPDYPTLTPLLLAH